MSDALRMEVARNRIAVVLVEPGAFRTGIFPDAKNAMTQRPDSAYQAAHDRMATLMRFAEPFMGNPQQVADVVASVLDARNPRDRYLVGIDARAFNLASSLTPRPVLDRLTRLVTNL